jgi:SAM-dependent methyltransferase
MHPSSLKKMAWFVPQVVEFLGAPLRVLDIGSLDVNGSYKSIFDALPGVSYVGADMTAGSNVDIVMPGPYQLPVSDASFELIVSGQTFEHIEYPWLTMKEMARVLAPGGIAIVIAPSSGPEHRYPLDCWRFYPDGMVALGKWAGLETTGVWTDWSDSQRFGWGDTVAIFRKVSEAPVQPALCLKPLPRLAFSSFKKFRQTISQVRRTIRNEWAG